MGVILGLLGQALNDGAERLLGPEPATQPATQAVVGSYPSHAAVSRNQAAKRMANSVLF